MYLSLIRGRAIHSGILCLSLLLCAFLPVSLAHAEGSWRRYDDPNSGLSVRYPAYWGRDTTTNPADPELVMTFAAPITNGFIMNYQPATVEMRVVRSLASATTDIHALADGFQQYYVDRPHIFRAFTRTDLEVQQRPAARFSYTMLGDDGTMYVTETWQAFGDTAVNLRLSTYQLFGDRQQHYESLYTDMLESLYRKGEGSLTATDNMFPLGRMSEFADPRSRSNIPSNDFTNTYRTAGGLQILFPQDRKAQPIYDNYISSSVYVAGTKKNALHFTVTITDLYQAFIAQASDFAVRKRLTEQPDSFWLSTVRDAIVARYAETVPDFTLLSSRDITVDGNPAVELEYRGKTGAGELVTRREVLTVHRRVLYSFVYETGTTETRTFEKMVDAVRLP
ncbi:hypothetical protein COU78_05210 [Candidatus Peregrinibacteria bacterium CG10_big_fil_rev_8_21_14_0_10_49_24]|nr:MAG: hypothetical protein COV83_01580 [Candidatus Peregrinibacteria bacterium CG11_big_fil_rev_8_21_14_0_20_49_14]PIR50744.1 MAG: hypothetical protein COU78_05210 [Candidatus Peregrinibacteria bacterium CG10_big_fil_rev_8_21_14_0_10_49_24]PJA68211.1 MAG: hypothetical protein CO157_00600 [Candidatus Peregrinibacteria bacterium CG_4_9_14_3_um_filter_49_12]